MSESSREHKTIISRRNILKLAGLGVGYEVAKKVGLVEPVDNAVTETLSLPKTAVTKAIDLAQKDKKIEEYPAPEIPASEYLPDTITLSTSIGEGKQKKYLNLRPHPSTTKGGYSLRDIVSVEDTPLGKNPGTLIVNKPRFVKVRANTDPSYPDERWVQLHAKVDPLDGRPARLTYVYIYIGKLTEEFVKFPTSNPNFVQGILDQDGNEVKTTVIVSPESI